MAHRRQPPHLALPRQLNAREDSEPLDLLRDLSDAPSPGFDTALLSACHATAPFVCHVPVGCCEVPHNPEAVYRGSCHGKRQTVITVPSNSFCPNGTGLVRSYVLLLRITEGTQVNDSDSGGEWPRPSLACEDDLRRSDGWIHINCSTLHNRQ